jgi:hypothetical protein
MHYSSCLSWSDPKSRAKAWVQITDTGGDPGKQIELDKEEGKIYFSV